MTDLRELFLPDNLIRNSLKQPLYRIPAPWESYPEYAEEIWRLISIMPRQSFEFPDNIALQSVNVIERFTSDERLKIQWIAICQFDENINPQTPGLFYKIETLIVRPLIRKQGNDLRACLPIGTFEEIADAINFTGDSLDEIEDALNFGSRIGLQLRIWGQPKKKGKGGKKSLPEHSISFNLFHWRVSRTDFTEEGEPTGNIFAEDICYLFPTCSYADVLGANLQVEKQRNLKRLSPLGIRLLEIFYWKALIEEQGKKSYADQSSPFGVPGSEISELFPFKDTTKFDDLVKEFDLLEDGQP